MADIILKLKLDGKEYDAVIQNADKQLSELRKKTESFPDAASKWGQIVTGFNQGLELANKLYSQFKDNVIKGAELQELREGFRGTAEDIEKFRQATMKTVTEANLIKLSNQATDLGISLKQQVILFSLADDASGKYGGSVETNFQKIVNASEGAGKGLKSLGIQQEVFNSIVEKNVKATGKKLEQLDAETTKQIKLEAIIEASGITLDDVNAKVMNNADKIGALGVRVDEARTKMGIWMTEAIIPLIDLLGESKDGKTSLSDAVITLGAHLPDVLISLFALKQLTGGATLAALGKYIALPIGLGVGAGMAWDEWGRELFGFNTLNSHDYSKDGEQGAPNDDNVNAFLKGNVRGTNIKGSGMINVTEAIVDNKKNTVQDVKNKIDELNKELLTVVAGSKKHIQILNELKQLNESVTFSDSFKKQAELEKKWKEATKEALKNRKERYEANRDLQDQNIKSAIQQRGDRHHDMKYFGEETFRNIEQLKIDAMREGFSKRDAMIELWYAEQKETSLYRQSVEARKAIDDQYFLKKKENNPYDEMTVQGKVFFDGMMGMTDTFWSTFLMTGREAKDEWDALWLAFYNSAMQSLGELFTNEVFSMLLGSGNSKNGTGSFWGDVSGFFGTILPFLGKGGVVTSPRAAIVGDVPEAIIPLHQLNNFSFGSGNIERKLDQVIEAFNSKQFEIDLFKLRTVNQTVSEVVKGLSIKS